MKRTSVISAVALIAVLGSTVAGFAHDSKGEGKGMGKSGQHERMGGDMGRDDARPDFATLDTDGDGKVTQAEMDAFKAARFAELDADGSGTVSATEMAAHHAAKQQERMTKGTERMIAKMDADGDGELSLDEMSGEMRKTPFERMDTDGDGALSEDEMNAAGPRGHGKGENGKGGRDKHDK